MGNQKKHEPVISVIIPVYNVAPYLREALDSVVNQTYKTLQILVIDDGSTDGSSHICDEYRFDYRVTVFHQENKGPSVARNVGLDHATGDYIAFIDSDDAYHPEFIQRMLDAIDNADIVECMRIDYRLTLDSQGQIVHGAKEGHYDRKQALRGLIYGQFDIGVWNKLYRRELWREIRFPEGHFHEDYEVQYSIFNLINKLHYLERPLYFRRLRSGSTIHTFSRKMAEDWKLAQDYVISFVETHIPEVFDESQLIGIKQTQMFGMIQFYVKGALSRGELKAACENVDPKKFNYRGKGAYQLIRYCPWLLKIIFPVYQPFRMLVRKVFKV